MIYKFQDLSKEEQKNIDDIIKEDTAIRVFRNMYIFLFATAIVSIQLLALTIFFVSFKGASLFINTLLISIIFFIVFLVASFIYLYIKRIELTKSSLESLSEYVIDGTI